MVILSTLPLNEYFVDLSVPITPVNRRFTAKLELNRKLRKLRNAARREFLREILYKNIAINCHTT